MFNVLKPSGAYMRSELDHHSFSQWHVACLAPDHYLNHSWSVVNQNLKIKYQQQSNQIQSNFILQNNVLTPDVLGSYYSDESKQSMMAANAFLVDTWRNNIVIITSTNLTS